MSITLSARTMSLAERKAASEGFPSVSEYIVHLVESQQTAAEEEAEFRAGLERSLDSMDRGGGRPLEEAMQDLAREFNIPRTSRT